MYIISISIYIYIYIVCVCVYNIHSMHWKLCSALHTPPWHTVSAHKGVPYLIQYATAFDDTLETHGDICMRGHYLLLSTKNSFVLARFFDVLLCKWVELWWTVPCRVSAQTRRQWWSSSLVSLSSVGYVLINDWFKQRTPQNTHTHAHTHAHTHTHTFTYIQGLDKAEINLP